VLLVPLLHCNLNFASFLFASWRVCNKWLQKMDFIKFHTGICQNASTL